MPAGDTSTAQPTSPSSNDSVDLAEFLAANRRRPPGWIDAVSRGGNASSAAHPPSAFASTNADHTAVLTTTRNDGSTPGEHTPATSCYPAEVTAMGSPIPVDTDDSDANINHLISRLGSRGDVLLSPPVGATAANGSTAPSTPPPSPAPAGAVPQAMAPPPPRTATAATTAVPDLLVPPTPPPPPSSAERPHMPHSADASSSLIPMGSTVEELQQHSPFGGSYNTSSIRAEQQTAAMALTHSAGTASDTLQHLTTYSSALMQALSRTEGAAVLSSQWASSLHPSRSYTADDGDDGSTGSSAYPPDIYEEAMRAKVAKQQWVALEKARQAVLEEARRRRDCPFAPQVSPFAARMRRPSSLRPENRVQSEVIRRKQWMAVKQQQEVERELQECTFRPLTVRAARLDPASLAPAGPAVFQQLYAEAEDRRVFEAEVKPLVVQQAEAGRRAPSLLMRQAEVAGVVDRLCARGAVVEAKTTGDGAVVEEGDGGEAADGAPRAASPSTDPHQPSLSAVSQRIVAAQVAAGERDPDVVQHLYRQSQRETMREQLKMRLDEEKAKVARAEQAMLLAQDRRRLQQEHYRAVLAAKYRALSRRACDTQRTTYRASAPQSVALLARASFDLLSIEETEELLSAVENCGRHKLREAEFIAVVFRHFAETQTVPQQAALLARPPPASTVVGTGAANAKRAGSIPNARNGGSSLEGSPLSLPKVKREKLDPELIAQIRENRALALEEWRQQHQRQRAIAEGIEVDENFSFQPAPRRLIPYACRPDVVVPVKTTKSEALRRAHIAARHGEGGGASAVAETALPSSSSAVITGHTAGAATSISPTEHVTTARELFSRLANAEAGGSPSSRSLGSALRARSRSTAAASVSTQREGSAAAAASSSVSPPPRPQGRTASVSTRGPSRSPPRPAAKPQQARTTTTQRTTTPSLSSQKARAPLTTSAKVYTRLAQSPAPAAPPSAAAAPSAGGKAMTANCACGGAAASSSATTSASLVDQIMQSTPEERARLGRELLLRQLREHQRRRGS